MTGRAQADLRDPGSFDHVGRDAGDTDLATGRVLAELAARDDRVVVATADLTWVTQLADVAAAHPDRFLQFGIAERNMISAAAGLATMGLIPYVSTFACFSGVLAFANIRTDLAYPHLPVRVLATHAGIAMGYFGTSHHATEDIAALRAVAGLTVLSPAGATATESLLRGTLDHDGPIYFRLGRGREADVYARPGAPVPPTGPGAPTVLRGGTDVLLVGTGLTTGSALDAAELLATGGVAAGVVDVHTLKPFDGGATARLATGYRAVVTVEEHTVEGGLGSIVAEALARRRVFTPVFPHGLQDEFALVGPPNHLYRYYGLDGAGVATVARRALAAADDPGADHSRPLWTDADRREVLADVGVGAR